MNKAKQYQGIEQEQSFVKRFARNPSYTGETLTLPSGLRMDNRRFLTAPEWTYCLARHHEFWSHEVRAAPMNFRNDNGDEGWFFPTAWVVEYAERFRMRAA